MRQRLNIHWGTDQSPWVTFIQLFLGANALAAVISLLLAPGSDEWFTWTIGTDASARALAVMYANALILAVVALRRPDWASARVVMVLITVFALAATALTLFHLDPFLEHPWYHLVYWLGGYAVLVATAPAVLLLQERAHGGRLPVVVPLSRLQRATAAVAALAMGAVALVLILAPSALDGLWPWELSPLVAGLLGVWLGAFAAAYAWALWDGDWSRCRPLFVAAPLTGLLLALVPVTHAGDLHGGDTGGLVAYYALAAIVAAPGLGLVRS
jgi:hypothetical protein